MAPLTQNYRLINTATPSHPLSPVLLQRPLANSAFWQLRSCSAASLLICFLAKRQWRWLAVRRPEFWSWLGGLKSIWLNVGRSKLSLFPRVQNKGNDPFLSPADLAGFLGNSEAAKNLKLLDKIENSPGQWRAVTEHCLFLNPGCQRFSTTVFFFRKIKLNTMSRIEESLQEDQTKYNASDMVYFPSERLLPLTWDISKLVLKVYWPVATIWYQL